MPIATTSRTRKPASKPRTISKSVSDTEEIAARLARTLVISDVSKSRGKQKALSAEEQKREAMRIVNDASQKLSSLVQNGWKKSVDTGKRSRSESATVAQEAYTAAANHLALLRELSGLDLNVERAAMSILGKLVALELYELALAALTITHPRLCALTGGHTDNLLAIPNLHSAHENVLLTMISTYLLNAIVILAYTHPLSLAKQLSDSHTLLEWIPHCSSSSKQLDSILTKSYSVLMKVSAVDIPSTSLFQLRLYALKCLTHTSPGTVQKPDSLWDQACKVASAFINASNSETISQAAQIATSAFLALVSICETRSDFEAFVSGKGFAAFCDSWIGFASKASNVQALEKIASLMRQTPALFPKVVPNSANMTSNSELLRRGTRLCAVLAQFLSALDQTDGESAIARIREVRDTLSAHNNSFATNLLILSHKHDAAEPQDPDLTRVAGKVDRALGRVRRSSLDALTKTSSIQMKEEFLELSEALICVYESVIPNTNSDDHFTQMLDTIFVLSRTRLNILDPRTYEIAYDLLARAVEILSMSPSSPPSRPSMARADFIRCTSGAFYNIGGMLYQAERYGSAIPFLKDGCRLGETAIVEHERCQVDTKPGDRTNKNEKSSSWTQLKEQNWRRFQLLAVCYMKIGDRRLAFDNFIQSTHSFPYSVFDDHINTITFRNLPNVSPAVKELRSVIEKLTHLGASELLLSAKSVSLKSTKLSESISAPVLGALMEWQIQSLEGSRWKEDVRDVLIGLLRETLNVYREGQMPVRTLRTLVKSLELGYHVPLEDMAKHEWLGVEGIEEEMNKLSSLKVLGQDTQLSQFRFEYEASIHLWLALYAHRRSDPSQVALASRHTKAACTILRNLLASNSTKTSSGSPQTSGDSVLRHPSAPKGAKTNGGKPSKVTTSRAAKTGRSGLASRGRSTKVPVTPKRKNQMPLEDVSLHPPSQVSARPQSLTVDFMESLMDLLQLSSHVLGVLSLTLPKISTLDVLRKLGELHLGDNGDRYLSSSADLALEYIKLGKSKRAKKVLNQALAAARNSYASNDTRAFFFLTFAASCAVSDDVEQSIKLYHEGSLLAGRLETPQKHASTVEKIQMRVARIEQTAFAYEVFALIQNALSNVSDSLDALLQALRLWNRAFESLGRLQPSTPKSKAMMTDESNPFDTPSSNNEMSTPTSNTHPFTRLLQAETPSNRTGDFIPRRTLSTGLEWRVSQGLLNTLFSLFSVYLDRGSPREAQYFVEQAKELAKSLNAPAEMCRALVRNGEVKLFQGLLEEGLEQFKEIERCVNTRVDGDVHVDLAELYRLKGDLEQRGAMTVDAQKHYEDAMEVIEKVDKAFSLLDGVQFGPRLSLGNGDSSDTLLPSLLAQILCRYAWLLRAEQDETYTKLLERFDSLPPTSTVQSQKKGLFARIALHSVYQRSRIDMFLSSIGETTIALSMGSNKLDVSLSSSSIDIAKNLDHAEKLFWSYLEALGQKGYVPDIRESAMSIATIKSFQASLGRSDPKTPLLTAGLLDASSSLTLRSEMLEVIAKKFPVTLSRDELEWPKLSDCGVQRPPHLKPKITPDDIDEDLSLENSSLKHYWQAVRQRYQSYATNTDTLMSSMVSGLPQNWTVVHISVTEDKNTMFISRQRGGGQDQPLVFCVPLKSRREDEEDEQFTFEDALTEMNEIVHLSNETTKVAASIRNDQAARAKWWKERGALDTRLRELLENIEFCWLGAFKTILSKNPHLPSEAINNLRIQFDRVFQRGLSLQDRKTKERALGHKKMPSESWTTPNRVTLDDALVECFSTLTPDCRDEELEDLVYFVLDLYQFHGVPVAIAEVDIDQVVVDLRSVLEEHAQRLKNVGRMGAFGYSRRTQSDEHLFLVLDKNVQGLPWESIPVLRERSVSRIPSTSFLLDRVQYSRLRLSETPTHGHDLNSLDRAVVDPRKVYYIINPSGDLERTEERFKSWLKDMEKVGWQGISGRAPSELQVLDALQTKDLVVYFGHGGAEKYVRSHKLRSLPRCATVMLWGCSSGALRDMGDFDRVGTPWSYMLAGCPTLVANLWDVTDKDIDTFSQSVFDKLDMSAESVRKWPSHSEKRTPVSVMQAVAESRKSCKLKYLTGAAPVVYGIPFYL